MHTDARVSGLNIVKHKQRRKMFKQVSFTFNTSTFSFGNNDIKNLSIHNSSQNAQKYRYLSFGKLPMTGVWWTT